MSIFSSPLYLSLYCIGIINSSSDSLFTYDSSSSFNSYYDPGFTPVFNPQFNNSELEAMAVSICGENTACLFDIAVTGRVDIGMSTIEQVQIIQEIETLSQPSKE